eukprot:jgi/Mesvir1/1630/Mv05066-RA.1
MRGWPCLRSSWASCWRRGGGGHGVQGQGGDDKGGKEGAECKGTGGHALLAGVEQDLTKRTYHEYWQRLPRGAVVDWADPAHRICALVRSLDYGRTINRMGVARVALAPHALYALISASIADVRTVPSNASGRVQGDATGAAPLASYHVERGCITQTPVAATVASPSSAVPGTILRVHAEGGVEVMAGDGMALRMQRVRALSCYAVEVPAATAVEECGLREGDVLQSFACEGYVDALLHAAKEEAWWVKKLASATEAICWYTGRPVEEGTPHSPPSHQGGSQVYRAADRVEAAEGADTPESAPVLQGEPETCSGKMGAGMEGASARNLRHGGGLVGLSRAVLAASDAAAAQPVDQAGPAVAFDEGSHTGHHPHVVFCCPVSVPAWSISGEASPSKAREGDVGQVTDRDMLNASLVLVLRVVEEGGGGESPPWTRVESAYLTMSGHRMVIEDMVRLVDVFQALMADVLASRGRKSPWLLSLLGEGERRRAQPLGARRPEAAARAAGGQQAHAGTAAIDTS